MPVINYDKWLQDRKRGESTSYNVIDYDKWLEERRRPPAKALFKPDAASRTGAAVLFPAKKRIADLSEAAPPVVAAPPVSTDVAPDAGSPYAEPIIKKLPEQYQFPKPLEAEDEIPPPGEVPKDPRKFLAGLVENAARVMPSFAKEIKETWEPFMKLDHEPTQEEMDRVAQFTAGIFTFIPAELYTLAKATVYPLAGISARIMGQGKVAEPYEREASEAQKHIYETGGLGPVMAAFGAKGFAKGIMPANETDVGTLRDHFREQSLDQTAKAEKTGEIPIEEVKPSRKAAPKAPKPVIEEAADVTVENIKSAPSEQLRNELLQMRGEAAGPEIAQMSRNELEHYVSGGRIAIIETIKPEIVAKERRGGVAKPRTEAEPTPGMAEAEKVAEEAKIPTKEQMKAAGIEKTPSERYGFKEKAQKASYKMTREEYENQPGVYIRNTRGGQSPDEGAGYSMWIEGRSNDYRIESYGNKEWEIKPPGTIDSDVLFEKVKGELLEQYRNGELPNSVEELIDYVKNTKNITDKKAIESFRDGFSPSDIIEHAGVFDNLDIVSWLNENFENLLDKKAIKTPNGLVVIGDLNKQAGIRISHDSAIKKALKENKPVPPEVLKDYPELAEKYGGKEPEITPEIESEAPKPPKTAEKAPEIKPEISPGKTPAFAGQARLKLKKAPRARAIQDLPSIVKQIERDFDVPIRKKYFNIPGAKGIYKKIPETIRIREANDLAAISHEVGHHIYYRGKIYNLIKRDKELSAEMKTLDYDYPRQMRLHEGFAEFMRYWMTDESAPRIAPKSSKWFESFLKDNPETANKLIDAKYRILRWREQGSFARVGAQILEKPENAPIIDRLKSGWMNFRRYVDDALAPIEELTTEAEKLMGAKLLERDSPSALATVLRNTSIAKTNNWIEVAQTDFDGNIVGPCLREIFKPLSKVKKIELEGAKYLPEFVAIRYAYAKHAIERWKKGKNPGISLYDARYVAYKIEALPEAPLFKNFSKQITKFSDNTLQYVIDSGALSPQVAEAFRKTYQNYLPLLRDLERMSRIGAGGGGKRFGDLPRPFKRAKGGGERIINPVSGVIVQTERLISWADRARVNRAIGQLIDKTKGIGHWGERIDVPPTPTKVKIGEALVKLNELGIEFEKIPEELLAEQYLTFWSTTNRGIPKDNIATFFDKGGELHAYQLKPELYRAVNAVDRVIFPTWIRILSIPKKIIVAGATGLRPVFGWGRNLVRDPFVYYMQSQQKTATPFHALTGTYKIVKDKIGLDIAESHRLFKAQAGEFGTFIHTELPRSLRKARRMIADNRRSKAMNVIWHPFELYKELMNIPESGPRLVEFQYVYKKRLKETGDHRSAWIAAMNARSDVTVNFNRLGSATQIINQFVPYFGPQVAGLSKMIRTFKNAPSRTTIRGLTMTAASVALWQLNRKQMEEDGENWYDNLPPWDKYGFWHKKVGDTIYRIPKPFEWGYIYSSIPEAAMNMMYAEEPDALKDMYDVGKDVFIPPLGIGGLQTGIEISANYDFFRERNIVPYWESQNVEAKKQYGKYTTETAKKLGAIFKVSPRKIDYGIYGLTGGMGLDIIRMGEKGLKIVGGIPDYTGLEMADIPFIGAFVSRDPTLNAFYDYQKECDKAAASYKRMESGEEADNYFEKHEYQIMHTPIMRQIAIAISDLRKQIEYYEKTEGLTDDERKAIIKQIEDSMISYAEYGLKLKRSSR